MRENRTYGSEGGEAQANASFLPLFIDVVRFTYIRMIYSYRFNSSFS